MKIIRRAGRLAVVACLLAASTPIAFTVTASALAAQEPQVQFVTRTISLRYLRPADAARLASPYVRTPGAGVYEAGSLRAVTVTETAPIVARIDSLLRENDRSPTVLTFRFQLIAADDTPGRDPSIDSLDAALRGLFRFKGYHLLGEGSTTAGEDESFSLTVAAGEDRFALFGEVLTVQPAGPGSVRVRVRLTRASGGMYQGKPMDAETLLYTGLTVPLGQTVILGSAAPGGANRALILAVHPEAATPRR
jgi:hypothetical protein